MKHLLDKLLVPSTTYPGRYDNNSNNKLLLKRERLTLREREREAHKCVVVVVAVAMKSLRNKFTL